MAIVTLRLKYPINTSLQAKSEDAQSGGWDVIYFVKMDSSVPQKQYGEIKKLGDVVGISKEKHFYSINVSVGDSVETPEETDYIFFGKNNSISSSGVTGYFAEVVMKNDSRAGVELFSVGATIVESSK